MPTGTKVSVYEGMGEQKPLCLLTRFEPLHVALAFPRRKTRVLSPIVEVVALAMFDVRKKLSSSHAVTPQFVGHDHSGRHCQLNQSWNEFARFSVAPAIVRETFSPEPGR